MQVRSARTGRPLKDARAIRRAVASREGFRPMAPVPGRGGQAQNGPHRMVGKRGTDMRSSRVLSPPRPHYPVSRVAVTGGRVEGAADGTAAPLPRNLRRKVERHNRKMRRAQMR